MAALLAVPIKIYTQPANVSVYINGTLFGISDRNGVLSEMIFLNAGRYTFRAEKPGYNGHTEVLDIFEATEVTLKLSPSGVLEVKALPVGALIRVDERFEATGHFLREVSEGRHYVEVSHPGYQSRYFYPEVKQYFTKTLEVALEREGNTRFVTEPAGAQVSVDGIVAGITPFSNLFGARRTSGELYERMAHPAIANDTGEFFGRESGFPTAGALREPDDPEHSRSGQSV